MLAERDDLAAEWTRRRQFQNRSMSSAPTRHLEPSQPRPPWVKFQFAADHLIGCNSPGRRLHGLFVTENQVRARVGDGSALGSRISR